jgi:aerobic-type carbon monoxide dehydrogenase small subunit (CoxS/CutS family)
MEVLHMSDDDKKESGEISRRQFLTGAGLAVGGAAIGAGIAFPLGGSDKEVEVPGPTVEVPKYVAPDGMEFATLSQLSAYLDELYAGGGGAVSAEGVATFSINGEPTSVQIEPNWSLAYVLREKLHLMGTKRGCDVGNCGVCTVIMDGRPVLSCLVLGVEAAGNHTITTIEGVSTDGQLTPLQKAMVENDATQCGFCTPGQVMTATALLDRISSPTRDEIKEFMAGALCRCGAHPGIVTSILQVGS